MTRPSSLRLLCPVAVMRNRCAAPRRRRGTILVIVLWIAFGLVSLALYFGQTVRWSYQASENTLTGHQAEQAIEGARRYIVFVLDNFVTPGERPNLDYGDYLADAVPVDQSTFWLLGRDPDTDATPTEPVWNLVDEASKLNLNTATQEMLALLPNMTTALAAAIVDWRDPDSELTAEGAESPDYEALATPYSAKNGPFESVEELRLVKGFDEKTIWGEDVNLNGILDANENDADASWPDDNGDGKLDTGLAEYVTAWTREPNTREDGSPKVNLQSPTARQDLQQLLTETFDAGRAQEIVQRLGPGIAGIDSPLEFYLASGLSADEFAKVEDAITVGTGDYRVGLVNVRTASAAVLACLPGMDSSKAEALVAQRRKLDETTMQSIAWVTDLLDATVATDIGPYITAKSYQCSADIVAVGANGRGLRRDFMVFDNEDGAKVIYRRDRTRMGWPLGADTRKSLRASESTSARTGTR